jgi:hypothetical protein
VYLPLLYQVAPAQQLSVLECLARGLGDHYCNETVRVDANETLLWSYGGCLRFCSHILVPCNASALMCKVFY